MVEVAVVYQSIYTNHPSAMYTSLLACPKLPVWVTSADTTEHTSMWYLSDNGINCQRRILHRMPIPYPAGECSRVTITVYGDI